MFDRAAYGCKLFCCWCAQEIAANRFWEAMGFVPLAFRSGSRGKGRTHIFWQRRVRAGDSTTPYWFPSQTGGGSLREDRLVLPIPPGSRWEDVMPVVLPEEKLSVASGQLPVEKAKALAGGKAPQARPAVLGNPAAHVPGRKSSRPLIAMGGLWFAPKPAPAGASARAGEGEAEAVGGEE